MKTEPISEASASLSTPTKKNGLTCGRCGQPIPQNKLACESCLGGSPKPEPVAKQRSRMEAVPSDASLHVAARAMYEALKAYEALDEQHANCEECEGGQAPELCEVCFPFADDARLAMRAALESARTPRSEEDTDHATACGVCGTPIDLRTAETDEEVGAICSGCSTGGAA